MLNMAKRIGDEADGKDDGEEEKPGLVVAISHKPPKFDPYKNVGEDDGKEDGGEDGDMDPEAIITEASEGLCKVLNVSRLAAPRVANYLKAIFDACDSMPHKEGEHEGAEEEE